MPRSSAPPLKMAPGATWPPERRSSAAFFITPPETPPHLAWGRLLCFGGYLSLSSSTKSTTTTTRSVASDQIQRKIHHRLPPLAAVVVFASFSRSPPSLRLDRIAPIAVSSSMASAPPPQISVGGSYLACCRPSHDHDPRIVVAVGSPISFSHCRSCRL